MSDGKKSSLIPFAIMGILALLCFIAIVTLQVLEYMHYDLEPSLWNRPGYVPTQEAPALPVVSQDTVAEE
ncbi:MAG: hypothetical protein GX811_08990 [Lentisphaerae bacterium]|nr:hypothetical protein [Lentisphaerota bacterium]